MVFGFPESLAQADVHVIFPAKTLPFIDGVRCPETQRIPTQESGCISAVVME